MSEGAMAGQLDELFRRRQEARRAGSDRAADRQRAKGKMTARERIDYLLDGGSFRELGMLARPPAGASDMNGDQPYTDGVVTGFGTVDGRRVCVYSQDFTVLGGTLGEVHAQKVHAMMDLATSVRVPVVGINDGGGARIQEGVVSLDGYAKLFRRNVAASGLIPQISVIMGPCAGGAVYSPAMTDFVFMVRDTAHMFITGPDVVKTVTGEDLTLEELGGAMTHSTKSGVATFVSPDEKACLDSVRSLLGFLPANCREQAPAVDTGDEPRRGAPQLRGLIPSRSDLPYDMKQVLAAVLDDGELLEGHRDWATNIICSLGRIAGRVVGVIANQPQVLAGVLDINGAEKAARFVRTCDSFNIPVVTFVDVPGFMPGSDQEHGGIIRHASKLLFAYCEATVPKVQVITRKAYGGAGVVMSSKSLGTDLAFAWPTAELAVMDPQGVVDFLHRRELSDQRDGGARRAELVEQYRERHLNPYLAAERGYVDDVIDPADTRAILAGALDMLSTKVADPPPRKHPNVPL